MSLTVTVNNKAATRGQFYRTFSVAFDSSYPTGGESFDNDDVALAKIDFVILEPNSGYVFEYDYTNEKIIAYYGDNDNTVDAALTQVANTTDLSGLTAVRGIAFGV